MDIQPSRGRRGGASARALCDVGRGGRGHDERGELKAEQRVQELKKENIIYKLEMTKEEEEEEDGREKMSKRKKMLKMK